MKLYEHTFDGGACDDISVAIKTYWHMSCEVSQSSVANTQNKIYVVESHSNLIVKHPFNALYHITWMFFTCFFLPLWNPRFTSVDIKKYNFGIWKTFGINDHDMSLNVV